MDEQVTFKANTIIIDNYIIDKFLLSGNYSEIYSVHKLDNPNHQYVLKYYFWKNIRKKLFDHSIYITQAQKRIENEIKNQAALNHSNIIQIVEVKQLEEEIFIIMEQAKGYQISSELIVYDFYEILNHYHKNNIFLSENEVKDYFSQIVSAVKYIHEQGLIHGDIKTENILLCKEGKIKIADFDWSRPIKREINSFDLRDPQNGVGTLVCYPPELLWLSQGKDKQDFFKWNQFFNHPAVDIWCLGIVLYELLTSGMFPYTCSPAAISPMCYILEDDARNNTWYDLNHESIQKHFLEHLKSDQIEYSILRKYTKIPSPDVRDLVNKMLRIDPKTRLTIDQVSKHSFLR